MTSWSRISWRPGRSRSSRNLWTVRCYSAGCKRWWASGDTRWLRTTYLVWAPASRQPSSWRRPSRTPDLGKTPLDVGQLTQERISRSIVEAYGRRLWGTPGDPHGATFRVILPDCDGPPP